MENLIKEFHVDNAIVLIISSHSELDPETKKDRIGVILLLKSNYAWWNIESKRGHTLSFGIVAAAVDEVAAAVAEVLVLLVVVVVGSAGQRTLGSGRR